MDSKKRSRKARNDDEVSTTLRQRKMSKNEDTSHTDTPTTDDNKTMDTSGEVANSPDSVPTPNSFEAVGDEFEGSEVSNSQLDEMLTEVLFREADQLIADVAELRRATQESQAENEQNQSNEEPAETDDLGANADPAVDLNATINTHNPDAAVATTSQNDGNTSTTSNAIDDSVIVMEDLSSSTVRPVARDEDEDVIFVQETKGEQRLRTICTIDLCDTPDVSFSSTANAPAASQPPAPTLTKCPICLDDFAFSQILSTICGHLYCKPCIKNAIKTRKKCPKCNHNLKSSQIHRIFLDH